MSSDVRDLYRVLGVSFEASPEEIKRAFRKIARQTHPDRQLVESSARFQEAAEAYQVLSHPGRRRDYDRFFAPVTDLVGLFARRRVGERALDAVLVSTPGVIQAGLDAMLIMTVSRSVLVHGGEVRIARPAELAGTDPMIVITIPHDNAGKTWCRIRGMGYPGEHGGEPGDLLVRFTVARNRNTKQEEQEP